MKLKNNMDSSENLQRLVNTLNEKNRFNEEEIKILSMSKYVLKVNKECGLFICVTLCKYNQCSHVLSDYDVIW